MEKIKQHFKENALVYLIIITCIIIFSIIYYINRNPVEPEVKPLDTSFFKIENLNTTIQLFDKTEPIFLVFGVDNCSATQEYVEYLRYEYANIGLEVHYLDLNTIDKSDIDTYNKLLDKLDVEYNLQGKKAKLGEFMGTTPMTIILVNGKIAYAHIGSISDTALEALADLYGLKNKK